MYLHRVTYWRSKTRCQWRYIRSMVLRCDLVFHFLTEIWDQRCWHQKSWHFLSHFQSENGNKYPRCPVMEVLPQTVPAWNGLYKSRTGRTGPTGRWMNHAPAILAAPALIYSTHQMLVVWIIVAHFHLCSLLDRYSVLEVWSVRRLMHVCCGSRWGQCVLLINIWDSLTAPCLVHNTALCTVYGQCGQYGRCMFIHWPVWPVRGLEGPVWNTARIGHRRSTTTI